MNKTYKRTDQENLVLRLYDLVIVANRYNLDYDDVENELMNIDYESLDDNQLFWYIEYLAALSIRIWYSTIRDNMNRVVEKPGMFVINEYSWEKYLWAKKKGIPNELITPFKIVVDMGILSPKAIEVFRNQCNKNS